MKKLISKLMMAIVVVAMVLAAFPAKKAYAADENPPVPSKVRLEKLWSRIQKAYERIGKAFEDTDAHISRFQGVIDKAAATGKDVSAMQAALDAYKAALTATRPQYEVLGLTIRTHSGFNANGEVTDAEKAFAAVKEARGQLKSIKDSMGGAFKALHEAIKAFREANRPVEQQKEGES